MLDRFCYSGPCNVFSFLLKIATGPYWQFPDPCYGTLWQPFSGQTFFPNLYFFSGDTSPNPRGVIIFLFNIGRSSSEAIHRVLLDPEFYLNAISVAMIVFVFLTSLVLGLYIYRQTNDKLAVLLSQLPILSFLSLRSFSFYEYLPPVVTNVTPEVLLISISSLFNLCFLKLFFAKRKEDELSMALLLGFLCGLGMASKLTFSFFSVPSSDRLHKVDEASIYNSLSCVLCFLDHPDPFFLSKDVGLGL